MAQLVGVLEVKQASGLDGYLLSPQDLESVRVCKCKLLAPAPRPQATANTPSPIHWLQAQPAVPIQSSKPGFWAEA